MNQDELLFEKMKADLQAKMAEEKARQPTSIRLGPGSPVQHVAEQLGTQALRRVKGGRWYALDAEGRLELAALVTACEKTGHRHKVANVIQEIAAVIPGWLQERPADDAGTVPELPIDKATGLRVRNPWEALPPRPNETTPRFDHASQVVIRELSPRLAKWLEDAARNHGVTMAMVDELASEKTDAEQMRKVVYDQAQWQANLLRPDSGANLTAQNLFARGIEDPYLLKFHRQEAATGSPRLKFDNLTVRMALAKRSPEVRELHRQAGEILKVWQAEAQDKAAAA